MLLTGMVILMSCSNKEGGLIISIDKAVFAIENEDSSMTEISDSEFFTGDSISLYLVNVGPFKADENGYSKIEMDIEITGPDGNQIHLDKGILGNDGYLKLENGFIGSPCATWYSDASHLPGEYSFTIKIYDLLAKTDAEISKSFWLK